MMETEAKNQPHGAWNSSEKSGMLQPTPPPAYQDIPAGYPQSFPSQPVPQGPYAQGPHPGQSVVSVVAVQPTVFVTAAPLANPLPDYLCYSIFTMLFCCFPLGIAALVYSCSTRDANMFGHQPIASRNSRMARILNLVSVAIGIILWLSFIIYIILVVIAIKHI